MDVNWFIRVFVSLIVLFLHAESRLLPREYRSTEAELLGIDFCNNDRVIHSSRGDFFMTDLFDQDEVDEILSAWTSGSAIEIWESQQIESKTYALVHPSTSTTLFASKEQQEKKSNNPIRSFQVLGERCSGTNFLQGLLGHFPNVKLCWKYGWKHFPVWFSVEEELNWRKDEETLFVAIIRNPYDWLQSLNRTPHHSDPSLKKLPFSQFIRSTWKLAPYDQSIRAHTDKDPISGDYFKNAIYLRSAKARDWLILREAPHNFFINYETLRDHPYAVIAEMADLFNLECKGVFHNSDYYKNNPKKLYKRSKYPPISVVDLSYINRCLDHDLEIELGYEKILNK